jgi:restriction endonuclease-like protein
MPWRSIRRGTFFDPGRRDRFFVKNLERVQGDERDAIIITRVRSRSGVELLGIYLQYAASNGRELGNASISGVPLNAFESGVFDCLEAAALKLIPQMGASQFRLDMVAQHPAKPGRYVLAIEFDGATCHSSYTARDRDRLRRQQIENLCWRFHRTWSTDWFMRKEEEIQRAIRRTRELWIVAERLDRCPSGQSTALV